MGEIFDQRQAIHSDPRRVLNDRLDWSLLRTFLFIGQAGSISKAAARLYITQSAVSQALKRLEEQLGATLILRRGQRFDLTGTGEEVLRIAADIYGNVSPGAAALRLLLRSSTSPFRCEGADGGRPAWGVLRQLHQ